MRTNTLKVAPGFTLDADYVAGASIALLGKRGAGKTYASRVLAECLFDAHVQTVIVDPMGVFWGLRAGSDGNKKGGLPIPVFGGEHGDAPLESSAGALMADLVVEEGLSMILDLSSFGSRTQERTFAAAFLDRLYRTNRDLVHLIVDEADLFCMSADTEILTDAGWARWDSAKPGSRAVAFDPKTSEYTYGEISRVIVREHDGEMVHLRTKGLDCLVTPEHRVLLQRTQRSPGRYDPKGYPWTFVQAADVPQQVHIPSGGAPTGPGILDLDDETLRILGWIITDGYWHDRSKSTALCLQQTFTTIKGGVTIADEMDSVLTGLPGVSRYDRGPRSHFRSNEGRTINGTASWSWYINGRQAARFLRWLGEDIHQIPRDLLENCSRDQLLVLFQGLMEGDGTFRNGRWERFFPGKNEALADSFQELALRLGINAYKTWVPQIEQWHVILNDRNGRHYVRKPQRSHYTGLVWDITVPTGAFVARRNGKVFVTGNCPQKPNPGDRPMLVTMENIVRRGRNKGIGITMASQRAAVLNKDVLTQIDGLVALRVAAPQDRDAIRDWVRGQGDEETWSKIAPSLPGLANGECWWWIPEKGVLKKVQVRRTRTFDSSPTRKRGQASRAPKTFADVDLDAISGRIAATIERAKAADPKELAKRIRDLERQLAAKGSTAPAPEQEVVKVPVLDEKLVARLEAAAAALTETTAVTATRTAKLLERLVESAEASKADAGDVADAAAAITAALAAARNQPAPAPRPRPSAGATASTTARPRAVIPVPQKTAQPSSPPVDPDGVVTPARQRLLAAAASLEGIGIDMPRKTQLALWAGVSPKSSGFANNLGALRTAGLIDYLVPGTVSLTDEGRALAGPVDQIVGDDELHRKVQGLVSPARWRILAELIGVYPQAVSKADLADAAGVSGASSGYANNLGALRTLGLLDYPSPGHVAATDILFLTGGA